MNLLFVGVAAWLVWLHHRWQQTDQEGGHEHGEGLTLKRAVAYAAALLVAVGMVASILG